MTEKTLNTWTITYRCYTDEGKWEEKELASKTYNKPHTKDELRNYAVIYMVNNHIGHIGMKNIRFSMEER